MDYIYDFLEYLKDNGLDVYNDDIDICYEEKTVYVFIDNITTADEAEEILKKIKAKIDEYKNELYCLTENKIICFIDLGQSKLSLHLCSFTNKDIIILFKKKRKLKIKMQR